MTLLVPAPDGFLPLASTLRQPAPRPVPTEVPTDGVLLGVNRFAADARPVALSMGDRDRHMYVVGQTGTGKSTLLLRMAMADIDAGRGACVIDPHGDLVDAILDRFPEERAQDLVLFDPGDSERPVGLNILDASTPQEQDFVIQETIAMMYRIYDPTHSGIMGPRWEHWFLVPQRRADCDDRPRRRVDARYPAPLHGRPLSR